MKQRPLTHKNLNDFTPSATEFFNTTNLASTNPSTNNSTRIATLNTQLHNDNDDNDYYSKIAKKIQPISQHNIYSPSTAEARRNDAAAPHSNLSYIAKKQQQQNTNNNLGSVIGGIKVLPTSTPIKLMNVKINTSKQFLLFLLLLLLL